MEFSIHTPARGATIDTAAGAVTDSLFNPHTREGCDFVLSV